MELIYLLTGLMIGTVSAALIMRYKNIAVKSSYEEKLVLITENLNELKNELLSKNNDILELNRQISSKDADYENLQKRLSDHKAEVEELRNKFNLEFKNLANEILEEKSKKFTEQNKLNLSEILKPLGEKIKEFEKKVEETYDKETQQRVSLREEVKRLAELNQQIGKDAQNLTKALKGDSKTQGNWGEVILDNILEKSGLVKDREYFVQSSFTDDQGKRLQPDVIVTYPGSRSIVIDAKVSLTAYERFVFAETDEEKEQHIKDHLLSVKAHVNELSKKNYQDLYQIKSLDFVMMFLPVEPAYLLAIQRDTDLWSFAYDKRVLLISPTNLIAALKMIVSLWRQEYQTKNAIEIANRSGDLYDKFVGFVNDLTDIGTKLGQTQASYDAAMNKLSTGKGSLVKRAQDLKTLGIKSKKELPDNLLEKSEESE